MTPRSRAVWPGRFRSVEGSSVHLSWATSQSCVLTRCEAALVKCEHVLFVKPLSSFPFHCGSQAVSASSEHRGRASAGCTRAFLLTVQWPPSPLPAFHRKQSLSHVRIVVCKILLWRRTEIMKSGKAAHLYRHFTDGQNVVNLNLIKTCN